MSTRQLVYFGTAIIVAAVLGFVIGVMIGGPVGASIMGYKTPRQLVTISLVIGMLMAVAFGSFVYYFIGDLFESRQ